MTKVQCRISSKPWKREIQIDSSNRLSFSCLRTLICKGKREFKKVCTKKSNKPFHYESGRLFSDNYRIGFYGYSKNVSLAEVFRIEKVEPYHRTKIEDALIYKCYHDEFHKHDRRASLMLLQSQEIGEKLVQYDLDTGQTINEIFLSHVVKFKYMAWCEVNEMLYVKSIHSAGDRSRFHMVTGLSMNISIVIAVFSAFPLQYEGMLEVDRRIFGAGIINAILSHGMLILMYITGHVRFYSFDYILQHYRQFKHDIYRATAVTSSYRADGNIPDSLPMNIKITECPPLLFEIQCADHDVKMAGFPWHVIYMPRGRHGVFEVVSLPDKTKAQNGTLSTSSLYIEQDTCLFHSDNSGRILHISASLANVKVLQVQADEETGTSEIKNIADINLKSHNSSRSNNLEMTSTRYTSSGRCIKKRHSVDEVNLDIGTLIHQVEYEDELDLTWISATNQEPDTRGRVCFYDNQSFQLLREIELDMQVSLEEFYEYTVQVDLDTIVQVVKPRMGQYICNVYRLSGDLNQVKIDTESSKPSKLHDKGARTRSNARRKQSMNEVPTTSAR